MVTEGNGIIIPTLEELKKYADGKKKKKKVYIICDIIVQNSFEMGAAVIAKYKPFLSSQWILDCISNMEIISNKYYIAF